ncbi:MAG: hypothetical protein PF689_06500 [Deltaproteobacteria bacterium]|jgi:hypothetical protein|nr:hypothetical protein [Deltaproteobacteria bacterium]
MKITTILSILLLLLSSCEDSNNNNYDWSQDGGNDVEEDNTDGSIDLVNDGSQNDGDVIDPADPPPDLAGVWVQKQILASVINYPMIGAVDTFHINYLLVTITQDGTSLVASEKTCAIDIEADTNLQTTIIPQAFVDSMDIEAKPVSLLPYNEGYKFYQHKYYQLQGINLSDVENEEMPTEADDPRVFDQDTDSNPGLTVRMTGTLSGELYVISREYTVLTSEEVSTSGFEGLIDWEGSQITVGASSAILNTTPESVTHPDAALSNFKYVKVDDTFTCEDVIAQKETLFEQ